MSIRASVVVPTYRRRDLLKRCVQALFAQDYPAEQFEIVIADDEASDETRYLAERWSRSAGPRMRYVAVTRTQGPAGARNAAWRAAEGDVVAFTDDDCLPQPGWLRAGVAAMEAGADAAWGKLEMPLPASPTDYELDASRLAESVFVTANCFCRRSALELVGGFDERFTAAWREDGDLYFSLLEHGCSIVHARDALVVHPIRPAPWGVSLRQQAKSRFDVLLRRKHPALYAQYIPPFPRLYLGIAASLFVAVAGAAFGLPWVAGIATAAWAVLTLFFCWRRLRSTSKAPSHIAEMALTSALIPLQSLYWRVRGLWQFRGVGDPEGRRASAPTAARSAGESIGILEHETA